MANFDAQITELVGGTIDQTSRPGYTIHKFTDAGPDRFIG